jgi:hypothetical protein
MAVPKLYLNKIYIDTLIKTAQTNSPRLYSAAALLLFKSIPLLIPNGWKSIHQEVAHFQGP